MADAAERLDALIPRAFSGDAHAFLVSIYKDPAQPIALRLDAAKAAVRYEKPALTAVDLKAEADMMLRTVSDTPLTADEWMAEVAGRKH